MKLYQLIYITGRLDRISKVNLSILRLAAYELLYNEEVPKRCCNK